VRSDGGAGLDSGYEAPMIEVLGDLRTLTQAAGGKNEARSDSAGITRKTPPGRQPLLS
jgi:hypothetical protein